MVQPPANPDKPLASPSGQTAIHASGQIVGAPSRLSTRPQGGTADQITEARRRQTGEQARRQLAAATIAANSNAAAAHRPAT